MSKSSFDLQTLFFRNRHLLALAIVLIAVAGSSAYLTLPRAEDPVIATRNTTIITRFPGADAGRVEALVTEVIERRLKEVSYIKEINSTSTAGVSVINVALLDSIGKKNNQQVFSEIRDAVNDARADFPAGVPSPVIDDKRGAVAYTLILSVEGGEGDAIQLSIATRMAEDLADLLRAVPGTELVRLFGYADEEILVSLDHRESALMGLDPGTVAAALARADSKVPAGIVRGPVSDLLVEVDGQFRSLAEIAEVPLPSDATGTVSRVGDVASVERAVAVPTASVAYADGRRVVLVAARMAEGWQVDKWAADARSRLEGFRDSMGVNRGIQIVFDQSSYTEFKLRELIGNLLAGAGVIVAVIAFFMGWRSALIVGSALPLVGGMTLFLLGTFGIKLHQMSIFGMIIALGLLIDNAIVVVEEVTQRLRESSRIDAVRETVQHLFIPLFASTSTTVLAFAPIMLLPGNAGDFVGSIGSSVVLAIISSFAVAMTIILGLAGNLSVPRGVIGVGFLRRSWSEGFSSVWLTSIVTRLLAWAFGRPLIPLLIALIPCGLGFVAATQLGSQFFPPTDRDMFGFRGWMPRSSSVEHTAETARKLELHLRTLEGVENVHWVAGGYFPAVYYNQVQVNDDAANYFQGYIQTGGSDVTERILARLQQEADANFPEAQIVLQKFAQGPPSFADVELRVFGPDVDRLTGIGEEIRRVLQDHPQILHTQASLERGQPKLRIDVDQEQAHLAGFTMSDLAEQLAARLDGSIGGSILEGPVEVPVRVRYDGAIRSNAASLQSLSFTTGSGDGLRFVPLEAIGVVTLQPEQSASTRFDAQPLNVIRGYTAEGALPIDVTRQVMERLSKAGFILPPGYRLEIGGNAEQQGDAVGNLARLLPVIVVLMVSIMILTFRSVRIAILLGAVAVGSVGIGQLATWAYGLPISFNTILGTIGLIGLAINDSIVVMAAILANPQARRGEPGAVAAEVMGSMRHVLSTTLTTMGGFAPLLIFVGGNFWPSLAIVLAAGVAGATLMAVLLMPAGYLLLFPRRKESAQ